MSRRSMVLSLSIQHSADLLARLLKQPLLVANRQSFGRNRRADPDGHRPGSHAFRTGAKNIERPLDRHWKNRQARAQREKESAALKRTHGALARAALFRKDDDRVSFANAIDRELERLHR